MSQEAEDKPPTCEDAEEQPKKPKIEIDEVTRERWIKQMMADFPLVDRIMCEAAICQWAADPEFYDKVERGDIKIPPPIERNTEYVYKGVTVDPLPEDCSETTVTEVSV
jgi:hypothetical protein